MSPRPRVLARTTGMSRTAWLDLRRRGIGGSDAATIVGLSVWSSPFELYQDKIGALPHSPPNEAMRWGSRLEPVIRRAFADETGIAVRQRHAVLQHARIEWMLANLDGTATCPDHGPAITEFKIVSEWRSGEWTDETIPDAYTVQTQHCLAVADRRCAWVGALIGGNRLFVAHVPRDDELIGDLIAVEEAFWQRVVQRRAPVPDGKAATAAALARLYAESDPDGQASLDADQVRPLLTRRQTLSAQRAAAKKQIAEIDNQIKNELGSREVGLLDGEKVVTWKPVTRSDWDHKQMEADHPDIAAKYRTYTTSRRINYS